MRYYQLSGISLLIAVPLYSLEKLLVPPWDDIRVKHTWNAVPPNWETLGDPPAGTTIDLHVALMPHNENALIDELYEVSVPGSPKRVFCHSPRTMYSRVPLLHCRYGAHLSREQVAELVAPHQDTLELVNSWLKYHDVPTSAISTAQGGSWVMLTGVPVSQANELLGASYQLYRSTGMNGITILRTVGYSLPAVVHAHVRTVVPTTHFSMRPLWQTSRKLSVNATADLTSRDTTKNEVKPADVRWLYKTFAYLPAAKDQNMLGIAAYENDYPSPADLARFMTEYRTDGIAATFDVKKVNNGGYEPNSPTTEGNLNIQWAQAMAYPTPHTFYSTGGEMLFIPGTNEPAEGDMWLEWLKYMLLLEKVPQTISTSYAVPEKIMPKEYATTLCNMFAQLGSRGVSLLFASGNDGVGNGDCKADDGSGKIQFVPFFPASCMCLFFIPPWKRYTAADIFHSPHRYVFAGPFVTSVGGTTGGTTGSTSGGTSISNPEVAAGLSGGGFSNFFEPEEYQMDAVNDFLQQLGSKYSGLYKCAFCCDLTGLLLNCWSFV